MAVTSEPLAGRGDEDELGERARSVWIRRAEVALVLLVLPLALALAVTQVVRASSAAGSRQVVVGALPVLVIDGGAGAAGVERVLEKLREAGIAARFSAGTAHSTDITHVVAPGAGDADVAAQVQRVLGVGTLPSPRRLQYGTGVVVVVGKDVLER